MSDNMTYMSNEEMIDASHIIEELKSDVSDLENYIHDLMIFLPISFCTVNLANIIIDTNKTLMQITGYPQHELMGMKVHLLFKDEESIKNLIKNTMDTGIVNNFEMILLKKDKTQIPIMVFSKLRKDEYDDILGFFVTFVDISKLKQMEETLKEKVTQLEKNKIAMLNMMEDLQETLVEKERAEKVIRNLNKDLENKVKLRTGEVENLLKQKDEFVNQLGHDLKNPLGPLINLLPMLMEKEDDPEKREMISILLRNVGYMKNLVVKTIELAKLNSPNTIFNFKYINFADMLKNVIKTNKLLFEDKKITVVNNVENDIFLEADSLRIEELFNNLFNNAVKYSYDEGTIIVDAMIHDDTITVSITDSGVGMNDEELYHIFDEFYKADSSRHDFDSSGLGMPIAKRIVEKHGGRIWAESEGLGKGSVFYFSIPLHSGVSLEKEKEEDYTTSVDKI